MEKVGRDLQVQEEGKKGTNGTKDLLKRPRQLSIGGGAFKAFSAMLMGILRAKEVGVLKALEP